MPRLVRVGMDQAAQAAPAGQSAGSFGVLEDLDPGVQADDLRAQPLDLGQCVAPPFRLAVTLRTSHIQMYGECTGPARGLAHQSPERPVSMPRP